MEINSELTGDLEIKGIKKYGESKTRMATAVLKVRVREDEAAAMFGDELHRIAFGGMVMDEGVALFPVPYYPKPELKCENHKIELLGHTVVAVPEVPRITTDAPEPAVVVELAIPLPCDAPQRDLIGDLAINCGEVVKAEFGVKQLSLPGATPPTIRKKDGAFGNPQPVGGGA